MTPIKILMLGGLRCGKTSLIASVFDQMRYCATNTIFTVNDITKVIPITGKEDILLNKRLELIDFIEKGGNKTFIVDHAPSNMLCEYSMQIQIPGTTKKCRMDFMDVPGSFFTGSFFNGDSVRGDSYIRELVEVSDVYVIVIDTPFMMEGSHAENYVANCMDHIHDLLAGIDEKKAKQVIFVPLKCEKWVQEENGYDEVVRKVEEVYSSTIKLLQCCGNTEISIIPIQTAGDIVFDSLKTAYRVVNDKGEIVIRECSLINDRIIIDKSGNFHKLQLSESVEEDEFYYHRLRVRSAWYRLKNDAKYRPYNCEQLPLHILRFVFNKYKMELGDGFPSKLSSFIFGSITVEDMQECLNKLSKANLIKDNIEGIKTIKKCF